jgi:ribosomal protein S18 acetylase RimI-like enzyme
MDCLYALAPLENLCEMQGLQDAGFRFVDVRVTLARDPSPADATGRSPHVRPATPNDVPALRRLAGELHRDSRFFADARFPPDRSRLLFEIWIEQLCAGRAGQVFVADVDGAPVGYVACEQTEPDVTRIQLIGVSPAAQRHGVGSGLLAAALSAGAERHPSPRVEVVTQGRNLGALRFYQRHGFLTTAQAVWYHWWA